MDAVEQWIVSFAQTAALISQAIAALIIAVAVVEAAWRSALHFNEKRERSARVTLQIRVRFGRWLTLGLEFLVAADILRTAVSPSWDELAKLAAIIALRTGLNFFLEREIKNAGELELNGIKSGEKPSPSRAA